MSAHPLTGRDAKVATLRAMVSISTLRAQHGPTKVYRDREAAIAASARAELARMGETS